jgi:transcription initiation factor TFIIIB Brf1 subunit/transcription initiation factor TFIIB
VIKLLREKCALLHLDNDNLLFSAVNIYKQFWGRIRLTSPTSVKSRERLCICVWKALREQNSPRQLSSLCHIFSVKQANVEKEIRKTKVPISPSLPSDYVSTLCQCLSLSFNTERLIYKYVKRIQNHPALQSYDTSLLLASCIEFIAEKVGELEKSCGGIRSNQHYSQITMLSQLGIEDSRRVRAFVRLKSRIPNVDIVTLKDGGIHRRPRSKLNYCLRWSGVAAGGR